MKKQLVGLIVGAAAAAALVGACSTAQPSIGCPVQRTTWGVRYSLSGAPAGTCTGYTELTAESVGIQRHRNPETKEDFLVIKPTALASLDSRDTDVARLPYAINKLPTDNSGGICEVASLSAQQVAPASSLPDGGSLAAADIKYEFSNVKVSAESLSPGNQMMADLKHTRDGCTANYKVTALWPRIPCADDDGNPVDDTCTHTFPDFPVKCDGALATPICVLTDTSTFPALK